MLHTHLLKHTSLWWKYIYTGSTASRRGPAPPRPTATPPSLPRTPVDQIDSESIHLRSHTPLSLGSIASLHNKVCKLLVTFTIAAYEINRLLSQGDFIYRIYRVYTTRSHYP